MEDLGAKQRNDVIGGGLSSCLIGCLPSVVHLPGFQCSDSGLGFVLLSRLPRHQSHLSPIASSLITFTHIYFHAKIKNKNKPNEGKVKAFISQKSALFTPKYFGDIDSIQVCMCGSIIYIYIYAHIYVVYMCNCINTCKGDCTHNLMFCFLHIIMYRDTSHH